MNYEEFKKHVDETLEKIYSKLNEEEKTFISDLVTKFNQKCEENERLLKIAKKMHLYIFLNMTDEQKAYDEIGLTDEENAMLGYSGEFILKGDKEC